MENTHKVIGANSKILAIVVRGGEIKENLAFLTPNDFSIQAGIHNKEKGYIVRPHKHPALVDIKTLECQEAFYIEHGKIKLDIYDVDDKIKESVILQKGDIVILNCGHGLEFLENTKMIEIRQGPYRTKEYDKTYIDGK